MTIISQTNNGISYLFGVLKEKAKTVTRVAFWKIPHHTPDQEDICLKIGRYTRSAEDVETPEVSNPKSELTLDNEEFQGLIAFLSDNYEPFKKGIKKYIPIDEKFDYRELDHVRAIFSNPDKQKVEVVAENRTVS